MAARFCRHCGTALAREGAKFCRACGKPLAQTGPASGAPVSGSLVTGARAVPAGPDPLLPPPALAVPAHAPPRRAAWLGHALALGVLAGLLTVSLAGVYRWESLHPADRADKVLPPPAIVPLKDPEGSPKNDEPLIGFAMNEDGPWLGRFGVTTLTGDPQRPEDDRKNLTFDLGGRTNNTRIWVDGETPIFGNTSAYGNTERSLGLGGSGRDSGSPLAGVWETKPDVEGEDADLNTFAGKNGFGGAGRRIPSRIGRTARAIWSYRGIRVSQNLDVVKMSSYGYRDTLKIEYRLKNTDDRSHEVGTRVMLDTLIGFKDQGYSEPNDGVPFVVPGRSGVTTTAVELRGQEVPDFIQAIETGEIESPGVIVRVTLRSQGETKADRVVLAGWGDEDMSWDYLAQMGGTGAPFLRGGPAGSVPDSCLGVYFEPKTLAPGKERVCIFYYGLGLVSSVKSKNAQLGLSCVSRVEVGSSFQLAALVQRPRPGQAVRISLPPGLALGAGEVTTKAVSAAGGASYSQVSWVVEAKAPTPRAEITATLLPDDKPETHSVEVTKKIDTVVR